MRKRGGRAQVAMEFLMTYGWALGVILITLGALVYTGVLNLDTFIVDRCEFSSGVFCIDAIVDTSGVRMALQNGMAIDLENVEVFVPECAAGAATGPPSLTSGEQEEYTVACVIPTGLTFKSKIIFNYTNPDSGFNHTKIGQLIYKVN